MIRRDERKAKHLIVYWGVVSAAGGIAALATQRWVPGVLLLLGGPTLAMLLWKQRVG